MAEQANRLLDRAKKLSQRPNITAAIDAYQSYMKLRPNDVSAALALSELYMRTENFDAATRLYASLLERNAANPIVLTNLGASLLRQGKVDDAKAILEYAIELDPRNGYARINLGGVLQAKGDLTGALKNALESVSIDPTNPIAFNNLGSAFNDLAKYDEAKHAFETALILDPNQIDAMINLATIESRVGSPEKAAPAYESVLRKLPDSEQQRKDAIRFYASFEYLKQGDLATGWDYYESGFSPLIPVGGARAPHRIFSVPRWRGEVTSQRLLVWREQGVGDEIMFSTCLAELERRQMNVVLECDPRLVDTLQRSYPKFLVRPQAYDPLTLKTTNEDFDLHIPIGSLPQIFRRSIAHFQRGYKALKTNPILDQEFSNRMSDSQGNLRIGICWRSGTFSPARNLAYTHLQDWSRLLSTPNTRWYNLQYGECSKEISSLKQAIGVDIVSWPDVDLKNDIDCVFSIMKNLDYVITVGTAVGPMAGAIGVPTYMIRIKSWVGLGQDDYPWMPSVKIFTVPVGQPVATLISRVEDAISMNAKTRQE